MFTKRIIPCLDVHGGRVVKGVNFVNLRDAGDPVEIAAAYDKAGADEVVFLDITDKCSIKESLMKIVDNPQLINEYAKKSWDCGLINHQIDKIQTRMYNDFKSLLPK